MSNCAKSMGRVFLRNTEIIQNNGGKRELGAKDWEIWCDIDYTVATKYDKS